MPIPDVNNPTTVPKYKLACADDTKTPNLAKNPPKGGIPAKEKITRIVVIANVKFVLPHCTKSLKYKVRPFLSSIHRVRPQRKDMP